MLGSVLVFAFEAFASCTKRRLPMPSPSKRSNNFIQNVRHSTVISQLIFQPYAEAGFLMGRVSAVDLFAIPSLDTLHLILKMFLLQNKPS